MCVCVCVCGIPSGKRPQCGRVRRYKDTVKTDMKKVTEHTAPFDRAQWRTTCQSATASFEESRLPSWTGNGQLVSSRSSTPPARFGRATDAAGPAHHGLGSSPIGVPIAVRRIRRCTPCVCGIPATQLNSATTARGSRRPRCRDAIDDFEATRVGAIQTKRQARKTDSHHPEH